MSSWAKSLSLLSKSGRTCAGNLPDLWRESGQVMTKIVSSFCAVAAILGVLLHAGDAQAVVPTVTRTWVSGAGADANPCTRALPCKTFAEAYALTSAGGEIDVLDGGDFGTLFIQKALTVANDGAGTAAVTTSSNGIMFEIQAGAADVVVLRGLNLNGFNNPSQEGVRLFTGGSLLIDHCVIQGYINQPAIEFQPPVSTTGKLWVTDTVLLNDGASISGSVRIFNFDGGSTIAHFERVQILGAIGNGIRVDVSSNGTNGAIDVELHDVTVDGATGGSGIVAVAAPSGGPAVTLVADEVTASHNAGYGLRAVGANATIYLSRSTITNNSIGIRASSGGSIVSYSDNRFANNAGGDGSPTSTMAPK
jgi:hypothetical protein